MRELVYLVITKIAMRKKDKKYPISQYGFWRRESTLPRLTPRMATSIKPIVSGKSSIFSLEDKIRFREPYAKVSNEATINEPIYNR